MYLQHLTVSFAFIEQPWHYETFFGGIWEVLTAALLFLASPVAVLNRQGKLRNYVPWQCGRQRAS